VSLLIVEQLQGVLNCPQKNIALAELAIHGGVQDAEFGQANQSVQRIGAGQLRLAAAVNQLQSLHKKFDIANGAGPKFDFGFQLTRASETGFDFFLHAAYARHHFGFCGVKQHIGQIGKEGGRWFLGARNPSGF